MDAKWIAYLILMAVWATLFMIALFKPKRHAHDHLVAAKIYLASVPFALAATAVVAAGLAGAF